MDESQTISQDGLPTSEDHKPMCTAHGPRTATTCDDIRPVRRTDAEHAEADAERKGRIERALKTGVRRQQGRQGRLFE